MTKKPEHPVDGVTQVIKVNFDTSKPLKAGERIIEREKFTPIEYRLHDLTNETNDILQSFIKELSGRLWRTKNITLQEPFERQNQAKWAIEQILEETDKWRMELHTQFLRYIKFIDEELDEAPDNKKPSILQTATVHQRVLNRHQFDLKELQEKLKPLVESENEINLQETKDIIDSFAKKLLASSEKVLRIG